MEQIPLNPTIMWTQIMGSNKPIIECNLLCKGEKNKRPGMLDTGADVTIIARSEWPVNWDLQTVAGIFSGTGGVTVSMQSRNNVITEGPEGKLATIRPFVNHHTPAALHSGLPKDPERPKQSVWIHQPDMPPTGKHNRSRSPVQPSLLNEDLDSPHNIMPEAREAITNVQEALSSCQTHRFEPNLPFQFAILGKAPYFHGLIFQ
ncbi:hypothetical protein TURU_003048 [Turdus rufiventris]|nr:hypothetical protein TURU_003048 [Turdus rufiventris]